MPPHTIVPLPTIRPTSPSGASPFALLPHELMAQVFLHLDPHTLYTSIRQLNHQWKITVEEHVIPTLFRTRQWRVALRIHKKPRRVHPNSAEGVAQAQQQQAMARGGREESEEARRERVLGTIGAWEDELDASPSPGDLTPPTITEYIPLTLSSLSPSTNTFHFTTGANWYALYEIDDPISAINDPSFRLDLNFGFAWRFEGDGKEDAPQRAGGWTSLDRENRWLSEFWCSTYDLGSRAQTSQGEEGETVRLNATRLARRRRLPVSLPAGGAAKKGSGSSNGQKRNPRTTLAWDDAHIEYLHLDVALGTEFFVRRSARANLLLRALEAEAARREEEEEEVLREKIAAAAASRPATPSQSQKLSTPSAWATPPKLQKPKATRAAGTPPVASSASSSKASSPPQASSTPLNGSSSPPPSSAPSSANSSAFLSPAEQLQLMAKSKAAAKVAGRRSANASTSSRAASRAASRANSRAPSAAPSRAPSRPPSRPGTPSGSAPSGAAAAAASARSPSPSPSPALHSHSASGYSTPGRDRDRDRDLPFTRALALAQSTASPYTARALSGYTTPNLATTSNVTLHPAITQARHGGASGSMSRGVSADSGYATPTRGATVPAGTSFAARGGGGAQPGGTPFAQFRGRLRRVANGFEGVEEGRARQREEKRRRGGVKGRRKRERSETVTAQRWAGVTTGAEEGVKGMSIDDEPGSSSPSYDESESEDEANLNGGGDAGEFGWQRGPVPYEGEGMMRTWREAKLLSSPEDTKGAGKGREAYLQGGATAPSGAEVGEIREVRPGVVETEWVWSR